MPEKNEDLYILIDSSASYNNKKDDAGFKNAMNVATEIVLDRKKDKKFAFASPWGMDKSSDYITLSTQLSESAIGYLSGLMKDETQAKGTLLNSALKNIDAYKSRRLPQEPQRFVLIGDGDIAGSDVKECVATLTALLTENPNLKIDFVTDTQSNPWSYSFIQDSYPSIIELLREQSPALAAGRVTHTRIEDGDDFKAKLSSIIEGKSGLSADFDTAIERTELAIQETETALDKAKEELSALKTMRQSL